MDESSVPPTISPPSANSPTISILSDYLSQKEMQTLHSPINSRSPLTVAETICKNPSILESVQNIIENGIEEKCKNLYSKTTGSILGYTNYQTMSQFSIDKLWNKFISDLPFLVKTLKVICKDYTDETKHDVKGAEATCVEIASEMKKYFRQKGMLSFNVL